MSKQKYSDEELINTIKELYIELDRIPNGHDFNKRKPNTSTFLNRFGSWDNALKFAGLKKVKQKVRDYTRDELIEYLHKFYREFSKVPTTRDLKFNKNYPHPETYRNIFGSYKNALIEANLFDLRKDKILFDRKQYSKSDLLEATRKFIETHNRIPIYNDFKSENQLPSANVISKFYTDLNDLIVNLGYQPIHNSVVVQNDGDLIHNLYKLYLELGRTPTSREIERCQYTASINTYVNRFGSIYESLDEAKIPYQKRTKFLSDDDIIDLWFKLKDKLNRVPTIQDMNHSEIDISHSINRRWGSYTEFLTFIGEESNYNLYGAKVYLTSEGVKCFSYLEYQLTQWLEDNDIKFKKDYPYRRILKNDSTKRTLDWMINYNNKIYYVELFGIIHNDTYDKKRENKIKDFEDNGIELVELYPDIIRNMNPQDVFSFLIAS